MKLITPTFEILEQAPGMDGMLKQIELCGRTCYKSQDKITEGSAEKFVERMKSDQHLSVLEHGAVYLKFNRSEIFQLTNRGIYLTEFMNSKYTKYSVHFNDYYITTNLRVIEELGLQDLMKYQCEPTEYHEKRVTVRFTTDIGISREFNRHRVNSPSEQSTRYCNYSKGKFGGELSVVPPIEKRLETEATLKVGRRLFQDDNGLLHSMCCEVMNIIRNGESKEAFTDIDTWLFANLAAQWSYMRLTNVFGWPAQDARSVLTLCTATELVHTAFVSDWKHFFALRCDSHAHPMARELAIPLREEFVKRGLIKELNK